MRRILIAAAIGAVLGAGGFALASQIRQAKTEAKRLSQNDIIETLNGEKARVTMIELTLNPGAAGSPHRHPGPVFGYVIEGEFEIGLGDKPARTLKAGETFYEPGGALHRVSRNPSDKAKTRVLAVMVHPRDAKQLATPADKE